MYYAAQTWGHKEFDEVEQLLRYFLKRSFKLPNATPNHVLMLETGLSPLFTSTLKMQIDYVLKTLQMEERRLPKKISMLILRKKISWFESWSRLAEACGRRLELSLESPNTWKAQLYDLLIATDIRKREEFSIKARSSTEREVYSRLNYNLEERNYFRPEYSTALISAVLKARCELLPLNFIPHREDLPVICEICNRREKEDVSHFIGKCPILGEIRRNAFGKNVLNDIELTNLLNGENWFSLFSYVKAALGYRKQILEERF